MLALASLAIASCSGGESVKTGEATVEHFHNRYNAQQLSEIYRDAAPELQKAGAEPEFLTFMTAVRRKLGAYKSGKTLQWHVNYGTGGTIVTLAREARFERGEGTEKFVLRDAGDKALLVGYNIESRALVVN
ncbi:MAG: hypothetical protein ABIO43_13590 [Sphingomicrobium sp.]